MESYQPIFEAVRQHCAAQGWYGAEMLGPEWRDVRDDDPRRSRFEFPPATEAQVQAREKRLGVALPPVLRACYTELANGGFGPGYGLRSLIDECEYPDDLVEGYLSMCEVHEVLDLDMMAASQGGTRVFTIPFEQWVRAALPLIEEGCAMTLCLDTTSGSIFRAAPSASGETFEYVAPTFEAML
ncbi:MAG TPA: SMI1/KNR4 family protein [Ktedonobacteraceae bacterium]|jgi:hypothetical protein|nr:SMI1/KNR4 family protein [Ktedonobacteraceae bacterium]